MNDQATKIQVVINTLQAMEIKATFDNMNHMMAVLKILAEVRDAIAAPGEEIKLEVVEDGKADSE
jgi:hypothetical protein